MRVVRIVESVEAGTQRTADGLLLKRLICTQPDCREPLALVHWGGAGGTIRFVKCPRCGKPSEFQNLPYGTSARAI